VTPEADATPALDRAAPDVADVRIPQAGTLLSARRRISRNNTVRIGHIHLCFTTLTFFANFAPLRTLKGIEKNLCVEILY
jgi:hypothetical protein